MTLNHYLLNITITDGMLNSDKSDANDIEVAALATDQEDAQKIVLAFYTQSGLSSKVIDGVHTLYRTADLQKPGSIRTVRVNTIVDLPIATVTEASSAPVVKPAVKAPTAKEKKAAAAAEAAAGAQEKTEEPIETQTKETPGETGDAGKITEGTGFGVGTQTGAQEGATEQK